MPALGEPAALPFANGTLINGKYLVEKEIAEGGVGIVVAAKNLALQQRVAIKYLKANALKDKGLVNRFVREARLSARITSDHVVRVFDVGMLPDGGPFMVMEYLTGHDLGTTVERGPLPVAEAVDYVLQACDALAEAHAMGIVHRDIKPENLFLAQRPSNTPIVKILDFGVSKVGLHRVDDGTWTDKTGVQDRFGTPLYMSPEQLRSSASVDQRSDIWSLGVVMYELLTGVLPFEGNDLPQLCISVLQGKSKPLTKARPDVPRGLERVVLRCLEKDATKRFQNVADLVQELVAFGPPDAAMRAARIRDVVIAGGESIRAPMLEHGGPERVPQKAVRRERAGRTTDPRVATTVMVLREPALKTRRVPIALAVAAVCAAAIGLGSLRSGPAASAVAPSAPETRATSAPSAGVPAEPVRAAAPEPPNAAVPVDSLPTAAPEPSRPPRTKVIAWPRSQTAVAPPSASAPQLVQSQPNNRRSLFGERN
jgi:tRNA A-37 threonylcarbamoyl transferase component Bud32